MFLLFLRRFQVNWILDFDKRAFLAINSLSGHYPLDKVMIILSAHWPWMVIVAAYLVGILINRNAVRLRAFVWIAATVGLSDVIAAYFLKPYFGRVRPCKVEELARIVDGCAGVYGFPSNHAANAACFAVLWLRFYGVTQGTIACLLAFFVGLSRVYLGVHYPADILAGFLYGMALALMSSFGFEKMRQTFSQKS